LTATHEPITTTSPPGGTAARRVPHDLEAESALLGAMMLSRDAISAAQLANVTAADFHRPLHGQIYQAIVDVHAAGALPDPVAVAARLDAAAEVRRELFEIHAATPASANAHEYARIVRAHARRRELIATAEALRDAAYRGDDLAAALAHATTLTAPTDARARLVSGATFVLDTPAPPAVWGTDDRVLWSQGESLMVVGPPGVGKTTLAAQLVAGRIGHQADLLGLPITPARRVLYLACDRPAQIARAFTRRFGTCDRTVLDERLAIWKGPPPADFARHPGTLAALAHDAGADCVFVDSLKDVALGLSDDETGAGLNAAIQQALADGIDVCCLHHQRKGQAGVKPKTLEDVYGSTWITAGAGSVVLLWGQPGDPIVELHHLKQPASEVGPIQIDHDHLTGITTVFRGDVDPLRILAARTNGMTAHDLAVVQTGRERPNDNQRRKAKRVLDTLVARGLAHKVDGTRGGAEGTQPDRYYAIARQHDEQCEPPEPFDEPVLDLDDEPY
jgi:replicative DNA helicase